MTITHSSLLTAGTRWRNWGRSQESHPAYIARATSIAEVIEVVRLAREFELTVRPIGAGHSFTGIAATDGIQLDVSAIDGLLAIDGDLATVGAGTHLYQLPALLAPHGLAMTNIGDIDRQTIAGAISTGTHGTGSAFGGLATQIRAMTLVTADGGILRVSETENAELLPAVRLGLGALGVIVEVTIQCVPAFLLRAVERSESFESVAAGWHQRLAETDHFEFYLWPHSDTVSAKYNTRLPIDAPRHPLGVVRGWVDDVFVANTVLAGMLNVGQALPAVTPAINRLATRVSGNREFTDYSHTVFASPRTTRFVEMEYAIPVEAVPDALRAVRALIEAKRWTVSFPIEVRAAASDQNWLSTAFDRETGYIAFHCYFRQDPTEYFGAMETLMRDFGGRPHWGKMHGLAAETLATMYPRFDDFVALRNRLDPDRVFSNPYVERVLGS